MSVRHDQAFREIRREYDDVVTALKFAERSRTNLNLGRPEFDSTRLGAAIATAGDAYALLLVARAEAFMRDYLGSLGTSLGSEPKLSALIDKSYRELNLRSTGLRIRANEKIEMHNLRVSRNEYAHGHGRNVFPSIPRVETVLSKFFWLFPSRQTESNKTRFLLDSRPGSESAENLEERIWPTFVRMDRPHGSSKYGKDE